QHLIPYHCVVDGALSVAVDGEPSHALGRGDVVLFPRNDGHRMGSNLGLPPVAAADLVQASGDRIVTVRHGGGGAAGSLGCGFLGCDQVLGNPIVQALPSAIVLSVDDAPAADWIRSTFQYAAHEAAAGRQGSTTVLAKLSELLFVEAVREHVRRLPAEQSGWLAGLRDPG